ncbi:MAG: dihydrolipoyl dehydrogenase [Gemmatimonadetes bacterium]|jgi:dihydrolipoamide dehydrogenase|nr:dihydrolipoyl dehydrogenase [Gemmatimonadota bacterium]
MPDSHIAADVVVIGGGPGGYVAAIRAAQLGFTTVCVEADKTLGGTCVNVGCIPSKALLESSHHFEFMGHDAAKHGISLADLGIDVATMLKRKDDVVGQNTKGIEFLFRKNKITWARGFGTLKAGNVVEVRGAPPESNITSYQAKHVIIATGSVPIELPFLKFDEERVLSNVGALLIPSVPKHLIVIGGGVIGLELGSVWRRLGAKVTVVELLPAILPGMDDDIVKEADKTFRKQGLDIRTGTRVTGGGRTGDTVFVDVEKDGATERIEGDYVLVSVGRRPSTGGIDAAALGLNVGRRGEILVDDQQRTNIPGVFAIGDCTPGPMLAHKAEEEGVVAAEVIAGKPAHMHHRTIPGVVYTWPEIAVVGLSEQQVKESGRAYKAGRFPFSANGRARTAGETTGFIKFIADATTDEILGCHMIGPSVSELIPEVVLAMEYRGSSEDIGMTVHAHPTLSETTKEAALAVLGRAIHF